MRLTQNRLHCYKLNQSFKFSIVLLIRYTCSYQMPKGYFHFVRMHIWFFFITNIAKNEVNLYWTKNNFCVSFLWLSNECKSIKGAKSTIVKITGCKNILTRYICRYCLVLHWINTIFFLQVLFWSPTWFS